MDEKVAFYLRHREHIEEWASLRVLAATELSTALSTAVAADEEAPAAAVRESAQFIDVMLPIAGVPDVSVVLRWRPRELFKPTGFISLPYIGVVAEGPKATQDDIKARSQAAALRHGLTRSDRTGSWVRWGSLNPDPPR